MQPEATSVVLVVFLFYGKRVTKLVPRISKATALHLLIGKA